MTCEPLDQGRWRLSLAEPEAAFLMNVLARLARHYREDLADLSPELRTYWQSGASVPVAAQKAEGAEAGESREVLAESRADLRSERRDLAESWLRDFELAEEPWQFEMTTAERDEFVSMLNDRRLILALETGLTQEELSPSAIVAVDDRRAAFMEIDVLGHFIMMMLGPQVFGREP
jgi:hypothetical protein